MNQQLGQLIAAQQEKALFLASVIRLLDACLDYDDRADLALSLSSAAVELADNLANYLDSVNLSQGGCGMKQCALSGPPVLQIYSRWLALRDKEEEPTPAHIPLSEQDEWFRQNIYNPMADLADEAMRLACVTPADFAAKMLMRTWNGDTILEWVTCLDLIEEAMALTRPPHSGGPSACPLPV